MGSARYVLWIALLLAGCVAEAPTAEVTSAVTSPIKRKVLVVLAGWNEMPASQRNWVVDELERNREQSDARKDGRSITVRGSDPVEVAQSFAAALNTVASNGAVEYAVTDVVNLPESPRLAHSFDDAIVNHSTHGVTSTLQRCGIGVDTDRLTFAQQWCLWIFHITARHLAPLADWLDGDSIDLDELIGMLELSQRDVDEVWVFGMAITFKMLEWTEVPVGGRVVPVMGFAYTGNPYTMWESWAHRAEDYLSRVYGTSCQGRAYGANPPLSADDLRGLTLCQKFMTTGTMVLGGNAGGFGTAHHPVNAANIATTADLVRPKDYDFANTAAAMSAAPSWDRKTDLVLWGPDAVAEPVACGTWHCNEEDYQLWQLSHMPDGTAISRDGVTPLDWWRAITATMPLVPVANRDSLELPRPGEIPPAACAAGQVRAGTRCVTMPAGCTGETFRDHGYAFCPGAYTWQGAQDECVKTDGHLATVADVYEQEFLVAHRSNDQWLGLYRAAADCQWHWVTGESLIYGDPAAGDGAWQAGMPDSGCGDQDCGSFWNSDGWDDDWCGSANSSFVCEWEP